MASDWPLLETWQWTRWATVQMRHGPSYVFMIAEKGFLALSFTQLSFGCEVAWHESVANKHMFVLLGNYTFCSRNDCWHKKLDCENPDVWHSTAEGEPILVQIYMI